MNVVDEVTNSHLGDTSQACFQNTKIMPNYQKSNEKESDNSSESSSMQSEKKESALNYTESNSCCTHPSSDSLMCLRNSEQYLDHFEFNVSNPKGRKKTLQDLSKYSQKQLQILIEDLTRAVEEVSSELVQLLLENDALQQESDARNIAIEQLLKMTVKVNESDLKTIQMSVILPDEDCDVM